MAVGEALVLGPGEGRRFFFGTAKVESDTADFSVFEGSPAPGVVAAAPHTGHAERPPARTYSAGRMWISASGPASPVLG